jgi:hypothetical protein
MLWALRSSKRVEATNLALHIPSSPTYLALSLTTMANGELASPKARPSLITSHVESNKRTIVLEIVIG